MKQWVVVVGGTNMDIVARTPRAGCDRHLHRNLAPAQVAKVQAAAARAGVPVAFEPVSVAKAARLADLARGLFLLTPNTDELAALTGRPKAQWRASVTDLHGRGNEHLWVRTGADGSWMCSRGKDPVHLPAVPATVVDVTGAGDAMLAGWIAAWLRGADPVTAAGEGHRAAAATVESPHTVRPDLAAVLTVPEHEEP